MYYAQSDRILTKQRVYSNAEINRFFTKNENRTIDIILKFQGKCWQKVNDSCQKSHKIGEKHQNLR